MDLYSILAEGRPKSYIADLDPRFSDALSRMIAAAPPELQSQFSIYSGARSNQRQAELYAAALKKYGNEQAARKWVAPPGRSRHNHGTASDLRYASPEARKWAHENAKNYGLTFPMGHEPWHIELVGARDGMKSAPADANPTVLAPDAQPRQMVSAAPPEPILGADARQAAAQQQQAVVPAQTPQAPVAANQSPIGNMLSSMMGAFQPTGAMPTGPKVTQDDSAALAMASQALSERGKQLKSQFLPNVDAILGLSKPGGVVI